MRKKIGSLCLIDRGKQGKLHPCLRDIENFLPEQNIGQVPQDTVVQAEGGPFLQRGENSDSMEGVQQRRGSPCHSIARVADRKSRMASEGFGRSGCRLVKKIEKSFKIFVWKKDFSIFLRIYL